jgi:GNAT superfamily N-acetyltransferase
VVLAVRPCTPADLAAVLVLARADQQRVTGRGSRLGENQVRDWWHAVDLNLDSWLLTAPDGRTPVGAAWLERWGDDLGVTKPVAAGSETLTQLLDLVEGRAQERGLRRQQVAVPLPDPVRAALLAGRGYREVRRFLRMAVQLDGAPPAAALPLGFTLHAVTPSELRAVHSTLDEAFRDHWEHESEPFDQWWRRRSAAPDVDLAWWFVVKEGDETVAAVRTIPRRDGGLFVATLGVRPSWRRRGLARALLLHAFARAHAAGLARISLSVDATNATGAGELYRSVGMSVELETGVWERRLTGAVTPGAARPPEPRPGP